MAEGEVTPGITAAEYAQRRARLGDSLPSGSCALFPAAARAYMSHDVPFPHHQETDLFYLSGLQEHSSLLACIKPPQAGASARWHLFVRPSSKEEELWDGPRAGVAGARTFFLGGGDGGEAHELSEAPRFLESELGGGGITQLFYAPKLNPELDAKLRTTLLGPTVRLSSQPPGRLVHSLRVRKSPAEIALMRRSGRVGAEAMNVTMTSSTAAASAGLTEAALAATFEFEGRLAGAERLAYPCVVAGGANATTLHYMHNNAVLNPRELLLMDAGTSLHGYCSDVTRTWPLGGEFDAPQRALYEAVLDVNERVIEHARADGKTSLNSLHRLSLQWTLEHLVSLGVLQANDPHAGLRCQRYFPHAIGHWLGLDVHDTPSVDSSLPLEPGMVVTVEPGLYIPLDDEAAPKWARGIGIRIEDDIAIGAAGEPAEVLTADCPKRPADIEAMLDGGGAPGVPAQPLHPPLPKGGL